MGSAYNGWVANGKKNGLTSPKITSDKSKYINKEIIGTWLSISPFSIGFTKLARGNIAEIPGLVAIPVCPLKDMVDTVFRNFDKSYMPPKNKNVCYW